MRLARVYVEVTLCGGDSYGTHRNEYLCVYFIQMSCVVYSFLQLCMVGYGTRGYCKNALVKRRFVANFPLSNSILILPVFHDWTRVRRRARGHARVRIRVDQQLFLTAITSLSPAAQGWQIHNTVLYKYNK